MVRKAQLLMRIGDMEGATKIYKSVLDDEKSTLGVRMDCTFALLRLGMFWGDREVPWSQQL